MTENSYTASIQPIRADDGLLYPFDQTTDLVEEFSDSYHRSREWLLASLAHYGTHIHDPPSTIPPRLRQMCPIITRFCQSALSPDDMYLLLQFSPPIEAKGRALICNTQILHEEHHDLLEIIAFHDQHHQLVFLNHVEQDKWVVFLVNLPKLEYEGYVIGDCPSDELSALQYKLGVVLGECYGEKFMYRQRLKIPSSLTVDPVFMVYLLAKCLHNREGYLDLTVDKINIHKCVVLTPFINLHDRWLGKLDLAEVNISTYPFLATKMYKDKLNNIEDSGWAIIDVLGDGNCGYYSLLLGLENNENYSYSARSDPSIEAWRTKVVELRKRLQVQSRRLLQTEYGSGRREQKFWELTDVWGAPDKDFIALSDSFADDALEDDEDYFGKAIQLNPNLQMDMNWAPHVFSYTFGMRVVVYVRQRQLDKSFEWRTMTFDYNRNPDDRVQSLNYLHRITDEQYRSRPTVELLFLTGVGSPHHVLFLRRKTCHQVPKPSPATNRHSLRQLLQREAGHRKVSTTRPLGPSTGKTNTAASIGKTRGKVVPVKAKAKPSTAQDSYKMTKGKVLPVKPTVGEISIRATTLRKGTKAYNRETQKTKNALTKLFKEQSSEECETKKLAVKLRFDQATGEFHKKDYDDVLKKYKTKAEVVDNIEQYNEDLVTAAVTYPGTWMFPSIGAPGNGTAPDYLSTNVGTLYQQHEKSYCLTYSMASALFYCGFTEPAKWLASQAPVFSGMDYATSITRFRGLMEFCVPIIGQPTIYGKRTARHNRFKRHFTWDDLFTGITSYPTLVVPILPNGCATHAFCVVDDLIFDSITTYALKLQMDSVNWVFNDAETRIFLALRFNKRCNPKGMKKKEDYKREVTYHWNHVADIPIQKYRTTPGRGSLGA